MPVPFPDAARIEVSPALADDLLRCAENLPSYDNKDFYSLDLQLELRHALRADCGGGYDELVSEVLSRLQDKPFCALVSGLTFDQGNRLFVALNRGFGNLVAGPYHPPRAQLVHYIQPATDIEATRNASRRTESERFHTDSADWPEPVEIISMVCVRPDKEGGGRSLVLDAVTLRQEIEGSLGGDAVELLERQSVPWRLADYLGGGVVWRPILSTANACCWRRYTIDAALAADGVTLPQSMSENLDRLQELIDRSDRALDFLMKEGELLFMDNHRTLHARTPLLSEYRTSGRLMLRSWIQTTDGASLTSDTRRPQP